MKIKRLWIASAFGLLLFQLAVSILLPTTANAWPSPQNVGSDHPTSMVRAYQAYWGLYWCTNGGAGTVAVKGESAGSYPTTAELREGKIFFDGRSYRTNHLSSSGNGSLNCNSSAAALLTYAGVSPGGDGDGILDFFTQPQTVGGRTGNSWPAMYVPTEPGSGQYKLNDGISNTRNNSSVRDLIAAMFRERRSEISFTNTTMPGYAQYFIARDTFFAKCNNGADQTGGATVRIINNDGSEVADPANKFIVDSSNHHVGYGMGSRAADDRSAGSRLSCESIVSLMNRHADAALTAVRAWQELNPDAEAPGGTIEDEDRGPTCEDAGGMAWLFCQVLSMASGALRYVDERMASLLAIEPGFFEDHEGLRASWTILRNIAYLLLVPIMLVMIISTALGFDFISAYTVKSALPRMVVATIFIALSFEITVFIVDFVQAIGYGIHNLLLYPFPDVGPGTTLEQVLRPPESFAGQAVVSGLVAWGAIAAAQGVMGGGLVATLAGFAGVAALALLAVLALLMFRHTLIVLLVLVSPLAILAWIFPGRTSIWNLWNKTFWLMMWFFPIIMVTTAVGKIMASIIASTGGSL